MVKNSKKSREGAAPDKAPAAPNGLASSTSRSETPVAGKAPAAKPAKTTKPPKAASKRAPGGAGKTSAARKPRATTSGRKTGKPGRVVISDEDIRLRAYFISEQRMQSGLPGDSAHDWLEARRQLQDEARA